MLKEFRTQRIVWDKANSRIFEPIHASEGDENGRRLEVQVVDSGKVVSLSGVTLRLAWRTQNELHKGLEDFDVLDSDTGAFELYYPTGMLKHAGCLRGSLVLYDANGKVESREFQIHIAHSVLDDEAIESSNEFSSLTQALVKIETLEEEYAPKLTEVTAQLAQTDSRIDLVSDFNRIGKIKLPDDFPKILPFELYRDHDKIVKHTMNLDEFELNAGHIHVKAYQGSSADNNDGLTEETAVRLFSDAINKANALPQNTVILHFYDDAIDVSRLGGVVNYTLEKNIIIKSHATSGRTALFTGYRMDTRPWIKEGNSYSTNAVPYSRNVGFDGKFKDYRDTPKKLTVVDTIQEVNDIPNSIYYGSEKTYIRTLDDREPDASIMLLQSSSQQLIFNLNNKRLIIRDFHFVWYGGGNSLRINGLGTNANDRSAFWHENCVFTQAKTNGLQVNGVRDTYGFNSTAYDVASDGFNYHALSMSDAGNEFVFEYQCEAFDCGNVGDSTMNATTAHEGMTVLRVGSVGYRCYGPVLADVNGCFSVNIDCNMYDSLRPTYRTRAGFFFDESGIPERKGTAYLLNCSGGGDDTWTFNTDGTHELYIQKILGNKIPNDIPYTVL